MSDEDNYKANIEDAIIFELVEAETVRTTSVTHVEYDDTPYGRFGDHCPYCGADWKAAHDRDCERFEQCQYPPGCDEGTRCGKRLCDPHFDAVSALFGPISTQ